jgi:stress response protein SCP2
MRFVASMSQVTKQFNRVQRAFLRVLDNQNRKLVEYEDEVWSFFQNCWHLKDWIKNDKQGVAKATRSKIEAEVNSYPALVTVGELTNKSKNLEMTSNVTEEGGKQHAEIVLTVVDKNGDEFQVKKLATDAMKNWMAIIKKYRI